jgi:2-dehydro-3-deoxyphosphooctonate aldolase (KDO 8-P synthase)
MPIVTREIEINKNIRIGGARSLFVIAGPCVIESPEHTFRMARDIKEICRDLNIPLIFKSSYDKANRSSLRSYRGPGLEEGLTILSDIKNDLNIPVLSDVHETEQIEKAAEILDVIQIPALLSRQTDLIIEAARTKKPLNIKKGQFLSPHDMANVVEKATSQGNESLILTERGTSFGYNNLVFDVRSIPIMKSLGFPVAIDASHSVQKPGGEGNHSGGEAEFIPFMARAGISAGADGVFVEVHDAPSKSLSDASNSLILNNLRDFLTSLILIKKAIAEE